MAGLVSCHSPNLIVFKEDKMPEWLYKGQGHRTEYIVDTILDIILHKDDKYKDDKKDLSMILNERAKEGYKLTIINQLYGYLVVVMEREVFC